jgi:hypothetical protein
MARIPEGRAGKFRLYTDKCHPALWRRGSKYSPAAGVAAAS